MISPFANDLHKEDLALSMIFHGIIDNMFYGGYCSIESKKIRFLLLHSACNKVNFVLALNYINLQIITVYGQPA